jgi:hypothetical protein
MHPPHAHQPHEPPAAEPLPSSVQERCCFECGTPAEWRVAIAGEDERVGEEDACERHAQGHIRMARLVRVVVEQKLVP